MNNLLAQTTGPVAGIDLPELAPAHKLNRILGSALKSSSASSLRAFDSPPWDADFFKLSSVPIFQTATPVEQTQILHSASQSLLAESYFIEKAGVGYMAKMTLMAETTEERVLYALFGADEAMHLSALKPLVEKGDRAGSSDPFLRLLASVLESSDRALLIFVIQVVLEGWGLSHYRSLSKGCCNLELSKLFHGFLQAEAKHHGTGVTLFDSEALSIASQQAIVEVLSAFLQMVQVGPQRVMGAIASVKGGLSRAQSIALLEDLDTESHSGKRLEVLRSLITPIAPAIADSLESHNLFSPLPATQCVVPGAL